MKAAIVVASSGGKDSMWTIEALRQAGTAPVGLSSTIDQSSNRSARQGIRASILQAQAKAMGLPLHRWELAENAPNADYEAGFAQHIAELQGRYGDDVEMAFGDLHLADIRAWRQALCDRLGVRCRFPLFGVDPSLLVNDMLAAGLEARVCLVDTQQLGASFAGRDFDQSLLRELPPGCDLLGEGGEFHTLATQLPPIGLAIDVIECGRLRDATGRFVTVDYALA